ncbi:TlpA disulfide reductase family protein [Terrihabitans sp. B22-R8]|uniref:TlpA disulfide reductase family protein n=1 Tax=Terrihabitans sp. B22-R8 TaxID=3425128 RepID=UPI00403D14CF
MLIAAAPEDRGSRSWTSRLAHLALAGALLCSASAAAFAEGALTPWTGGTKPAFTLDSLDGPKLSLEDLRGQIVLVHFFATWCEPCVEEMASLERLNVRLKDEPFRIVAIDVGEVDARVRTFFRDHPVSFPVVLDRDRAVLKAWEVGGLPTSYLLGRDLLPAHWSEGPLDWDSPEVEAVLRPLFGTAITNNQNQQERETHP